MENKLSSFWKDANEIQYDSVISEEKIRSAYLEYQMNLINENDHPENSEVPYQYT